MSNANELRVKNLGILCEKIINGEIDFFQSKILEQYDFEKAITRFKKTKEQVVRKSMIGHTDQFELYFDVNKSKDLLWDIIFLGKYIDSKITNEDEKNEIITRIHTVILEGVKEIQESISTTENSFQELKKSVVLFQKVRDALSHNQDGSVYSYNITDKTINIHAVYHNNKLTCEIPLEYINTIGLGIKSLPEDKEIAEEVTEIVSIISSHQGFTIEDLPNLFYRVSPNHLSYLLSKCDNDLTIVEKLPTHLLTGNLDILKYLIDDQCLSIDNIKNYKVELFNCSLSRLSYLFNIYESFDEINKLKGTIFNCDENTLNYILNTYGKNNINYLDEKIFLADISRIKKINEIYNFNIAKINELNTAVFQCDDETLDYLLRTVGIDKMNKLNYSFYFIPIENIDFILKNIQDIDKINQLTKFSLNSSLNNLEKIYNKAESNIENFVILSNKMLKKEENIDRFLKYDLNILLKLNQHVFEGDQEIVNYLLSLKENNILELNDIPPGCFRCDLEQLKYLLSQVNYSFICLKNLNPYIYYSSIERMIEIFNTQNKDLINNREAVLFELFEEDLYDMETVNIILENKDLFSITIRSREENRDKFDNTLNMLHFDSESRIYLHDICNLSYEQICILLKINANLIWMSKEEIQYILNQSNGDLEILKYVNQAMLNCDKQRFDYLMKRHGKDYEEISKIPKELFEVDSQVFQEIYDLYEFNRIKSFMKTDNPKLIAIEIYLNQFFSTYKNEIDDINSSDLIDTTMFNITTMTPILTDLSNSLNNSIQSSFNQKAFKNLLSINVSKKDSQQYLNIILNQLNKMQGLESNLHKENKNIITSIRNCGEHMQVFPDENDPDSVILESSIVRNGVKAVTFVASVKYTNLITFIQNLENNIKNASYSKSIQHKSELTDSTLYSTKKEQYEAIKNIIIKKYLALDYLNKIGIYDVKETIIDDEIYYIYEEAGNEIKTKIDNLVVMYQKQGIGNETTIEDVLTPRIFK